jgi:hypothetical protein
MMSSMLDLFVVVRLHLSVVCYEYVRMFFRHVVSLFTAIPVEKTCEHCHIRNKLMKYATLQRHDKQHRISTAPLTPSSNTS